MNLFGPPPTVLKRLTDGLKRRTDLDTQFQLDLFNRILQLLRELQQCPGAIGALPPGTAGQLTITEAELAGFIYKLEHPENMGPEVIEDIVDPLYSIGNQGDNTLRRTAPGGLPGNASVLPRSTRRPREVPKAPASRFGFSSLFGSPASSGSPEEPGSYKPPATGGPSYLSRLGFGSRKAPPAGAPGLADDLELSTLPGVPSGLPSMTQGSRFGPKSGGKRTRRARKYRNRT